MAQWKRIRLRIWGLQVRSLPGSSFYTTNKENSPKSNQINKEEEEEQEKEEEQQQQQEKEKEEEEEE